MTDLRFGDGMMFTKTPCEVPGIGHDMDNLAMGYDLQGTIALICPRPYCMELVDTIAVDDLTNEQFDELQEVLKKVASSEQHRNEE